MSDLRSPVLGCIADDVTGATDLANNLVLAGMPTVQINGVPDKSTLEQVEGANAIVVALKTRSVPATQAVKESIQALRALQTLGIERFYFKYCSTFDSTEDGNIGPVAESLMADLEVEQTIFCPAFPRAGRTVYKGHLFVHDQLLSESHMRRHPLNPMNDANLVRVLDKQTSGKVGLLSHQSSCDDSSQTYARLMNELQQQGVSLVVTDACNDSGLMRLADAFYSMPLLTGGSGLARFLAEPYRKAGLLNVDTFAPSLPQVKGRSLIVAGSCSTATLAQVDWMKGKCPAFHIDIYALMGNAETSGTAESIEHKRLHEWFDTADPAKPVLIASSSTPDIVQKLQSKFGTETVATAVERFLARATTLLVERCNVRRLILAGGETSGAIMNQLGVRLLKIGPEICTGVPWCETEVDGRTLALALKSGNFGDVNFFEAALEMLS